MDKGDWLGITLDGTENYKKLYNAFEMLNINSKWTNTWISFEPIIQFERVKQLLYEAHQIGVDRVAFGKLNHYGKGEHNWSERVKELEELCQAYDIEYLIKESLRKETDVTN